MDGCQITYEEINLRRSCTFLVMVDEIKGFVIFVGIWGVLAFTLAGCMERKLRRLAIKIHEIS